MRFLISKTNRKPCGLSAFQALQTAFSITRAYSFSSCSGTCEQKFLTCLAKQPPVNSVLKRNANIYAGSKTMKQEIFLQSFCTKRCERAHLPQHAAPLMAGGAEEWCSLSLAVPRSALGQPSAPWFLCVGVHPELLSSFCLCDRHFLCTVHGILLLLTALLVDCQCCSLSGQENVFSYALKHCI